LKSLLDIFRVKLQIVPCPHIVAKRSPHTTSILAKGTQNIQEWLCRPLPKKLHLLCEHESWIGRYLHLVIQAIEPRTGGQSDNGEVVVENLPDAHRTQHFHGIKEKGLQ
jgi:hypothetical protein